MNKIVCLYALSGLFAGAIFSSCICDTPKNYKAENDCNLLGSIIGEYSFQHCAIFYLQYFISYWTYNLLAMLTSLWLCRRKITQHNNEIHSSWLPHSCNQVSALPHLNGLQASCCTLYHDHAILGGIYTISFLHVRVIIKLIIEDYFVIYTSWVPGWKSFYNWF